MKVLAISGPSCSGKSTLARHLRHVLPHAAILYQDDFYLPESQLPRDADGQSNWDCPAAFDMQAMHDRILEIKTSNQLPIDQNTREEHNNNDGLNLLTPEQAQAVKTQLFNLQEPILIVEGILLFYRSSPLFSLFDTLIMCPFDYRVLKQRRERRVGYDTPCGDFWQDPPHYFDSLVWPEFLRHYKYLFEPSDTSYSQLSSEAIHRNLKMPPLACDFKTVIEFVVNACNM